MEKSRNLELTELRVKELEQERVQLVSEVQTSRMEEEEKREDQVAELNLKMQSLEMEKDSLQEERMELHKVRQVNGYLLNIDLVF